jgi:hypothetical protein
MNSFEAKYIYIMSRNLYQINISVGVIAMVDLKNHYNLSISELLLYVMSFYKDKSLLILSLVL